MRSVRTVVLMLAAVLASSPAQSAQPLPPAQAQPTQAPPTQAPPAPPLQPPPAPAAAEWPSSGEVQKVQQSMSQRLVLNRGPKSGGPYWIERGGVLITDSSLATGLEAGLVGSDQAVAMAHEAHEKLRTGAVLGWTGLGLTVASLVVGTGFSESIARDGGSVTTAEGVGLGVSIGALVAALVLDIIAGGLTRAGSQLECDAVNTYNSDLVDGKLRGPPPAAAPVSPPR